jgi:hypothetical protein
MTFTADKSGAFDFAVYFESTSFSAYIVLYMVILLLYFLQLLIFLKGVPNTTSLEANGCEGLGLDLVAVGKLDISRFFKCDRFFSSF